MSAEQPQSRSPQESLPVLACRAGVQAASKEAEVIPLPKQDFITPEAETKLLAKITEAMCGVKRTGQSRSERTKILRYGWDYNAKQEWLGDLPDWLLNDVFGHLLQEYDSVTINEYQPGDQIPAHIDSLDFSDPIQILSLGSPARMAFKRNSFARSFSIKVPPRSLLTLTGVYRWNFTHAVLPVRALRHSIVFRKRILK